MVGLQGCGHGVEEVVAVDAVAEVVVDGEVADAEGGEVLEEVRALTGVYAVVLQAGLDDDLGRGYGGPLDGYAEPRVAAAPTAGPDEDVAAFLLEVLTVDLGNLVGDGGVHGGAPVVGLDVHDVLDIGDDAVAEGANMPSTPGAIKVFQDAKILYSPGKASNAGGVSVSGLEMSQNSERLGWSAEEVDAKLLWIMENIHENCVKYGTEPDGYVNYVKGANVAGFMKVAKAMMAQGLV